MNEPLRFGPAGRFALDVNRRTLHLEGQPRPLGARAFDLLRVLIEARGQLVTKERLLQTVWPGLVVEEANVHTQVSQLRKLLDPAAIATIQGLGYRFAWPLQEAISSVHRHNLPASSTSLVGRQQLLAEARSQLGQARILSLVGIGGSGKTRVALALASQVQADQPDGVWWIDLAPLDHGIAVVAAVSRALRLAPSPRVDPVDAVAEGLSTRHCLLVLDNCEHLLDVVAELAGRWLAAAPRLTLLLTSREALGLAGETVLPVRPLALPSPKADDDQQRASESVRLLQERAAAVVPGFSLQGDDLRHAVSICRCLDGLPLAIELAAVQLRVLSPPQLLALLQQHFKLLAGHRRALPRQQTMQYIIQWSYEQLQVEEQFVLMALAVCSGGCELEAVAVIAGTSLSRLALVAALNRLVDLSLLTVRHEHEAARYHLLETVRQFALDKLGDSGDSPLLRARHAAFYARLAEDQAARFERSGVGAPAWAALDRELDNLLRVLDTCERDAIADAPRIAVRLLVALQDYWLARGMASTGLRASMLAIERTTGLDDDRTLLRGRLTTALLLWAGRGDDAAAVAMLTELLSRAQAANEVDVLAGTHLLLGRIARYRARLDEAQQHFDQARGLADKLDNGEIAARAARGNAQVMFDRGHTEAALAAFDQLLASRRRQGHVAEALGLLLSIGTLATDRPALLQRSRAALREALDDLPQVGSTDSDWNAVQWTGYLAGVARAWCTSVQLVASICAQETATAGGCDDETMRIRQRTLDGARQALGDQSFEDAWSIGAGWDLPQSLQAARSWLTEAGELALDCTGLSLISERSGRQ